MNLSRQEKAFELFKEVFVRAMSDQSIPVAKETVRLFDFPIVYKSFEQAFSNVLWDQDKRVEHERAEAVKMYIKVIQKVADPDDVNTKKIIQYLESEALEDDLDVEPMSQNEIDAVLGDEEEDNSPIPL